MVKISDSKSNDKMLQTDENKKLLEELSEQFEIKHYDGIEPKKIEIGKVEYIEEGFPTDIQKIKKQ